MSVAPMSGEPQRLPAFSPLSGASAIGNAAPSQDPPPAGGAGVLEVLHSDEVLDHLAQSQSQLKALIEQAASGPSGAALAALQGQLQAFSVLSQATGTVVQVSADALKDVIDKTV